MVVVEEGGGKRLSRRTGFRRLRHDFTDVIT
jgi:hypothetical protein